MKFEMRPNPLQNAIMQNDRKHLNFWRKRAEILPVKEDVCFAVGHRGGVDLGDVDVVILIPLTIAIVHCVTGVMSHTGSALKFDFWVIISRSLG